MYILTAYILFFLGVQASEIIQTSVAQKDPGLIVIDEVVGLMVALFTFPMTWKYALAGFLLFRLFDITKPFPGRYIDRRVSSGFGVMADDVAAGLYANLCLQVLRVAGWL